MDRARSLQHLIVFDADCVHCSRFANFLARRDRAGRFRFAAAASPTGRALYARHGLDPDAMETHIVIVDGVPHFKMRGLTAALRAVGWPEALLRLMDLTPRPVADWLYDRIARNRRRFSKRACPAPSPALRARLIE